MNNKLTIIIIIIILALASFWLFRDKAVIQTETENTSNAPAEESGVVEGDDIIQTSPTSVREFSIDGAPYSLTPGTLEVNQGDTVKITFKSLQGTHDFRLDEFNVSTRILNTGGKQTITFVADKTGIFEYYCSVGNHRALGMVGTITIR